MGFPENFKSARKAAGLTQQQVADELGLNRTAIVKYEKGICMPSLKNIPKICTLFHISLDELIDF